MTRRIYLNSSHPSEFELSRRTLYNCHPWRQFTGDQRPRIYYPGIITHIIYYSGVRSRRDPTDFPEFETDFDWQIFAPIFNFFSERNFVFLSSRKDIWRVVAFNGVLIYFGSHLPYLFSILSIISGFFSLLTPLFISSSDNKSVSHWIMFDYFFHVWKVNISFFLIMFLIYSCSYM